MATVDVEKLVIQIEARTRSYENALKRIEGKTQKMTKRSSRSFKRLNKSMSQSSHTAKRFAVSLVAIFAGGRGVKAVKDYGVQWQEMSNKLAAATQVSGMQARSIEELNKVANRSRGELQATVSLYAMLLRSTKDIVTSENQVARVTETISKAFKAGGASAQEQASGILQIGQALQSGFLQGDELRSIRENAPLVAQAIADEFKTTIGGLKQLGSEGKLTSDRVLNALLAGQGKIEDAYKKTSSSVDDSMRKVGNALLLSIGQSEGAGYAFEQVKLSLNELADALGSQGFKDGLDVVLKGFGDIVKFGREVAGTIQFVTSLLNDAGESANEFVKLKNGKVLNLTTGLQEKNTGQVKRQTARDQQYESKRINDLGTVHPKQNNKVRSVPRISSNKGGISRRNAAADEAKRQKERIQGVVDALKFEAEQLGRTETMQRVYNEIKSAGVSLDSQQGQQIQSLVEKLSDAEKQTEAMAQAQQHLNEAKTFFGELAAQGLTDIILEGGKAKDVIVNLTKALAQAALQGLLLGKGPLGGLLGGGSGGGGIFGSIFGGLLGAKAIGGPVAGGKSYVVGERGREIFTPPSSGRIIPNNRINSGNGMTVVMHNDFRGADSSAIGAISSKLNQMQRDLPNIINGVRNQERRLNPSAA